MMTRLRRFHEWITDLGYVAGALTLCVMTSCYLYEVVARYFFDAPTRWSSIAVAHLLLVTVFLLLPHVTQTGAHVNVNLLHQTFPRLAGTLRAGANLIGLLVCLFAAWIAIGETIREYVNSIDVEGTVMTFPKWWTSGFITYGLLNSAVWFGRAAWYPTERFNHWSIISGSEP